MTMTVTFLRHRTARRAKCPPPFAGRVRRRLTNHTGLQLPRPFQRRYRKPLGGPPIPFVGNCRRSRNPSILTVTIPPHRRVRVPKSVPVGAFRQGKRRRARVIPYTPVLPLRHRNARRPIACTPPPPLPKRRRHPIAATTKATAFRKRRRRAPPLPPFMGRVRRRQPAPLRAIPPKAAPPTLGHRKAHRSLACAPAPFAGRCVRRPVPGSGRSAFPVLHRRVVHTGKAPVPFAGRKKRRRVPGTGLKAAPVVLRHRKFKQKHPPAFVFRGHVRRSRWVAFSNTGYVIGGPYLVPAGQIYAAGAVAGDVIEGQGL